MKITFRLSFSLVVLCLLGLTLDAYAERGDAASQQEEIQKALEMMKKQGMDEKTQKQMENMFKNMSEVGAKQQEAKLKKAQQKFETETAGHGTAQVEVDGKRYDLTMLKCEITDRNTGHFSMHAQQMPGMDKGELWVRGGGSHSGSAMQFSSKNGLYEALSYPTFQWTDKTLEWEGMVGGEKGKVPLKFRLTCGGEMVDYATASKPNPTSAENVLTLQSGQETHIFQADHCSTKEYRTGNLIVEFEATATGMFRGRPAIILLSKSHPVESKQSSQNMDLLLGELTQGQRGLSPLQVQEQLRNKVAAFEMKETAAIQKKYQEQMAAYQKQFDTEMLALKKEYGNNIPPEKMADLMDPMNTLMDAQGKEMDNVREQAKAMQYPKGRSFGVITVKGQEVHFGGSKLSPTHNREAPEFQNLPEKTELWVTCGK